MNHVSNNGNGNHKNDSNPYQTPEMDADRGEGVRSSSKLSNRQRWLAVTLTYVCSLVALAGMISMLWWSTGDNYGYRPNPPMWAIALAWSMDVARWIAATIGIVLVIEILVRGTWWQRFWVLLPGYYLGNVSLLHLEMLIGTLKKMI